MRLVEFALEQHAGDADQWKLRTRQELRDAERGQPLDVKRSHRVDGRAQLGVEVEGKVARRACGRAGGRGK
jgi:hypothetical protein